MQVQLMINASIAYDQHNLGKARNQLKLLQTGLTKGKNGEFSFHRIMSAVMLKLPLH